MLSTWNCSTLKSECNVSFIITKLLKDESSDCLKVQINNVRGFKNQQLPTTITQLKCNRFNSLQQSLLQHRKKKYECQEECCSMLRVRCVRVWFSHLFIPNFKI